MCHSFERGISPHHIHAWLPISLTLAGCASGAVEARYERASDGFARARTSTSAEQDHAIFGARALDREALIGAVLARNPSAEAARSAWRAALSEVPQATSLDDPMLTYMFAPLSIGADDVNFGQRVEVEQRLPFPGKLGLQGAVALAEAEAAEGDFASVRLDLALMASLLFDDYFVAERALEVNREHIDLLEELKESAAAQYAVGRASQQDALQAEVELAHLAHQDVVLHTQRAVIVAELNGLLHREPSAEIPPPPAELTHGSTAALDRRALYAEALEGRPEMRAAAARIQGRRSAIELAERDYYPDFQVMGSYDSMWGDTAHRWMLGGGLNIPIQLERRRSAVRAAEARLGVAKAELLRLEDKIRVEVESAIARVEEAHHVLVLFERRLVPAARDQVDSATVGFISARNSFLAVIEAEKNLRSVELGQEKAFADMSGARARLSRALGRPAGLAREENER